MNTVINRFFTKSESMPDMNERSKEKRHSLLRFMIEQGSKTTQLDQLSKRATEFVFPQNESFAELQLVQLYLEIESYLIEKDPGCIQSKKQLRELIRMKFPDLTETDAFSPLYVTFKNQEIVFSRNFLKFFLQTLKAEVQSEKLVSRWLGMLNFRLLHNPDMDLVKQINVLRKLKENSLELYNDFVDSYGQDLVDTVIQKCHREFSSFYDTIGTIRCIDDLIPGSIKVDKKIPEQKSIKQHKTNGHVKINSPLVVDKKAILENIPDGFIVFDKQANIVDYNRNALQMLGVSEKDIKKRSILEFLPDSLSKALKADIDKKDLSIPNVVIGKRHETVLKNEQGDEVDFELTITNNYTEQDSYSIFLKNITDKKDTLKAIEEGKINAERMANAKSTFLSNMSHEIRTPLNVILGLSEIIKKNTQMDEALLRKNLDGIDFSAQNLLSIVNDILDFSKIEAGKLSIQTIDFNLRKVVTNLTDGFEIKANEKGLNLVVKVDDDIPAVVIGDQYRLNQILTNLVGNAIKFTHTGEITVNVNAVSQTDEEIELQFQVEDTGIGIPEDKLSRIFDSFYQVENPDSSKITGTGLGLAITKELIQLQDGVLTAKSEVDKGSVFEYSLVYKKSKLKKVADSVKTYVREDKKLKGLKVLVAEDNKMNQFYIKQLLNNLNVEVDIAENGKEAVDIFQHSDTKYDLVLMDMHMPVMSGLEAISTIRKSNKDSVKKVPIVACSADVFPEARKKAIKVGIDFYLTKPLNEEAVKEVLFWLISDDDEFEPHLISDTETAGKTGTEHKSSNVDINQLRETFDNDDEFIISLLEIFIKETPEDYNSMRNCMDREYYTRASALAHKLKSSFMNLGMTTHGHHLQQIEVNLTKKEGVESAKKHLAVLSSLYTKALIEITILLIELKQK